MRSAALSRLLFTPEQRRKPAGHLTVDWSSDLADGLRGFWVHNGATLVDLVTGAVAGAATVTSAPPGLGFSGAAANLGIDYSFGGTQPITVASYITVNRTPTSSGAIVGQETEVVLRFSGTTAFEFVLNSFSTNDRTTVTPDAAVIGRSTTVVGTYGPSGKLACTVDGYKRSEVTPTGSYANVSANFFVGNSGLLANNNIPIHAVAILAREWTPEQIGRWHLDPFGSLLRPVSVFVPKAADAPPVGTGFLHGIIGGGVQGRIFGHA